MHMNSITNKKLRQLAMGLDLHLLLQITTIQEIRKMSAIDKVPLQSLKNI